ncbi:MAG: hypothetical protein CXT73_06705 [Methanobacteriota archaeon]|nr:MAG: hypothetical protein CXT73_06705 [Euryarchaeota archaeon]
MKLTNLHLLGIVLLSIIVGAIGILGIKETYENLEKPRHVHEDYMCSVVPKKIPKDVQMKHYASSNDIEEAKKQHNNECRTAKCRAERAQISAVAAGTPANPLKLTQEELACMEKKANTPQLKKEHVEGLNMITAILQSNSPIEEKKQLIKKIRQRFEKQGCHAPRGGNSESSINAPSTTGQASDVPKTDPNYRCLRLNSLQHDHMNEERVGRNSLERRRRLPCSQIPEGTENNYILKTKIVPPVCPKCPDCPTSQCLVCDKKKQRCKSCGKSKEVCKCDDEIEDDLDKNEIDDGSEPSRASRRREKRRGTSSEYPAQNAPGVMEAANRNGKYNPNRPNQTAFAAQSSHPIARLNSFSAFG